TFTPVVAGESVAVPTLLPVASLRLTVTACACDAVVAGAGFLAHASAEAAIAEASRAGRSSGLVMPQDTLLRPASNHPTVCHAHLPDRFAARRDAARRPVEPGAQTARARPRGDQGRSPHRSARRWPAHRRRCRPRR